MTKEDTARGIKNLFLFVVAFVLAVSLAVFFVACSKPEANAGDGADEATNQEITVRDISYDYDGKKHGIEIEGLKDGDRVEYSADGINYTEESIEYSEAGAYEIYYRVERDGEEIKRGKAVMYISKRIIKGIACADKEIAYDGEAHGLEIDGIKDGDTVKYSIDGKEYTDEAISVREVGEFIIYYSVERGYEEFRSSSRITIKERRINIKIDSEDVEIVCRGKKEIDDIRKSVKYDGEEHGIRPETTGTVCVVRDGEYTTEIPRYREIGVYEYEFVVIESGYLPTEVRGVLEITENATSGTYYRANGVITINGNRAERNGEEINIAEITPTKNGIEYGNEEYKRIGSESIIEIRINGESDVLTITKSEYILTKVGTNIKITKDDEEYYTKTVAGEITSIAFCGVELSLMPSDTENGVDEPFYVLAENVFNSDRQYYLLEATIE